MRARNSARNRVTVIGAGYVGLTVAAALASRGFRVTCVDKDESRVSNLQRGRVPFVEPGLEKYVERGLQRNRLRFAPALDEEALAAEVVFLAVGTPSAPDGRADLSAVFSAADELGRQSASPKVVVIKSTVPVGTGDELEARLRARTGRRWHVVSNPEFLREGTALYDYLRPDRIGPHFLRAGLGYGGSCFPKDVSALIAQFADCGLTPRILPAVEQVNQDRRRRFLELAEATVGVLRGTTLAVWGLAFKPGTSDMRHAPALDIVPELLRKGAHVRVYDPAANDMATAFFPGAYVASSTLDAARGADAVLVLTDWPEFARVDLQRLKQVMARPLIVDGRGLFPAETLVRQGFVYRALGRHVPENAIPAAPALD